MDVEYRKVTLLVPTSDDIGFNNPQIPGRVDWNERTDREGMTNVQIVVIGDQVVDKDEAVESILSSGIAPESGYPYGVPEEVAKAIDPSGWEERKKEAARKKRQALLDQLAAMERE